MDKESEGRKKETGRNPEEIYRSMRGDIPVGIFRSTLEGKILSVNPALVKMFGYSCEEEILALSAWNPYVDPDQRRQLLERLRSDGAVSDFEIEVRDKTGSVLWVSVNGRAVKDGDGNMAYLDGTIQDITERKLSEDALKKQLKYEEALSFISQVLLETEDFNREVKSVLAELLGVLDVDRIHLFEHFEDPQHGTCARLTGQAVGEGPIPRMGLPQFQKFCYKDLSPHLLDRLLTGEAVGGAVSELPRKEKELLSSQGIRSVLMVPIHSGKILWGLIGLADTQQERIWNQRDIKLVQRVASVMGTVLERGGAEEEVRYRMEFENLITAISTSFVNLAPREIDAGIDSALNVIGEFVEADRCYLFQFSKDATRMSNTYEWCADGIEPQLENLQDLPVNDFPWFMAQISRGDVVHCPRVSELGEEASAEKVEWEAEDIQSLINVPMVFESEVVGFIGFDSVRKEKKWSESTIALLRIVGEMFANALDRKRSEEALRRQAEDLALINDLNNAANQGASLDDIATLLAERTKEIFSGFGAGIYLLTRDKKNLELLNVVLPKPVINTLERITGNRISNFRFPLKEGDFYSRALLTGKSQLVNDPRTLYRFVEGYIPDGPSKKNIHQIIKDMKLGSLINVPLGAGEDILGFMNVSRRTPLNEDDLSRLETLGRQVTTIIKRKLAEEKEREYLHNLWFLSQTAMDFVEQTAEEDIYAYIADRLGELVPEAYIALASFDETTNALRGRSFVGLGEELEKTLSILGRDPMEMRISIQEEFKANLLAKKIQNFTGSLYDLTQGALSRSASSALEKHLGVGKVYAMGLVRQGRLLGVAVILTRKGKELGNQGIVEAFINEASVALQRKLAEERERRYFHNQEFLAQTALEFVALKPEQDIYQYIVERLQELIDGAVFIAAASFDEIEDQFRLRGIWGLEERIEKIVKLIGKDPVGMPFSMKERSKVQMFAGRLGKVSGDLRDLTRGSIPEAITRAFLDIFGIENMYSIGFSRHGRLLGTTAIIMAKGTKLSNKEVVEAFMNQAAVALQRRRAEEREKEYLKNLDFLSRAALDFVDLETEDDIYTYICQKLKQLIGEGVVAVVSFDHATQTFTSRSVQGFGDSLRKVIKILGRDPEGIILPGSSEVIDKLNTGKLVRFEKGLYQLSQGAIPKAAGATLETMFDLGEIISIGFTTQSTLLGAAVILNPRNITLNNQATIESFANQASVVLRRRRAEEALRESEQRLSLHVQQTPLGVIEWNLDFEVVKWNPAAEQIFGYTQEEALNHHAADLIVPDSAKEHVDGVWKALLMQKGGNRSTNENITKDGRTIQCEWYNTPLVDAEGKVIGVASLVQDITKRRLAEEALEENRRELAEINQMLQQVLDTIPVRIFWKDRESVYLGCNQLFARDSGLNDPSELIGKTDYDMGWREQAELYRSDDAQVINSGEAKLNYEEPQTTPDGKRIWLRTSKVPLRDIDGRIIGVLGTYEDITERKKTEEQLIRASKLASVGVLAAGIAHQVNNPLATMMFGASALRDLLINQHELPDPVKQKVTRFLSTLDEQIERTRNVVSGLLSFTQTRRSEIKPTDVNLSVRRAVNFISTNLRSPGIEKDISLADNLPWVCADPVALEEVLVNVIQNAYEAMGTEGRLSLSTEDAGEDMIRIIVADTGSGIPPERREEIFEPLYTTKDEEKGTGVGLSVSVMLLERFGGRIWVEDNPSGGAMFIVEVPKAKEEVNES